MAQRYGVSPEQILPGTGSSDIFGLAARAYVASSHVAACPQYSFVGFEDDVLVSELTQVGYFSTLAYPAYRAGTYTRLLRC